MDHYHWHGCEQLTISQDHCLSCYWLLYSLLGAWLPTHHYQFLLQQGSSYLITSNLLSDLCDIMLRDLKIPSTCLLHQGLRFWEDKIGEKLKENKPCMRKLRKYLDCCQKDCGISSSTRLLLVVASNFSPQYLSLHSYPSLKFLPIYTRLNFGMHSF